ncbi:MAG: hypothetical protein RLZZ618_3605 [Pseudomonadota bacterium]|jgi:purine-binding chemotaxis protein CheW
MALTSSSRQSALSAAAAGAALTHLREFLAFKLGAEEYGIDLLRVQEIRSYEEPTRIANSPPCVTGVLDLRGMIVPIVDMRLHLRLGEARHDSLTVIIVLSISGHSVGMVVDAVSDVISLAPQQLRQAPDFNSSVDSTHLLAIGAVDDRMLILIDIEKLMQSPSLGLHLETALAA